MDINELKERIKTEHQSGHFKLQSIFDRYLDEIERLLSMGMKHRVIYDELNLGISFTHYNNIILRARKKGSVVQDKEKVNKPEQSSPVVETSLVEVSEWEKIGINNPRLIKSIERAQLTPDEIKSWNCANEMQISKRITEYLIKMNKKGL